MFKKWLQKKLVGVISHKLFNTVTSDDILKVRPDGLYVGGHKLPYEQAEMLREDAERFLESYLWKVHLQKNIQNVANLQMYKYGKDWPDMLTAKNLLRLWEIIDSSLKELKK